MSELIEQPRPKRMSSREIAELCEKRHDNVVRDIRNTLGSLPEIDLLKFEETYSDTQGREQFHYSLPKDLTLTVVSGYRVDLRYRIIKRLEQLEQSTATPPIDYSSPEVIVGVLQAQQGKIAELKATVVEQAPKVAALDRIAASEGSLCITDAAKDLGVPPRRFFAWLQANEWIYRRLQGGGWVGYQTKVNAGYLEHDIKEIVRPDGSTKSTLQVRVTPKGITQLAKKLSKSDLLAPT